MPSSDKVAIGMGGSGARCAEALTYLLAAGLGPPEATILLADADTQNFNVTQAAEVIALYQRLQPEPGQANESHLFGTRLLQPDQNSWTPFPSGNNTSLERHFGYAAMTLAPAGAPAARLLESMYSREQRQAELNIGFRGKPSMGAAICGDTFSPEDQPWKDVLASIRQNAGGGAQSWVFGMGSVFGGMGAAGLPTIPSQLKRAVSAGGDKIRLGDLLLLPYFSFPAKPESVADHVYAQPALFPLNSREALRYYGNQRHQFNDFYVLGCPDQAPQSTFALGSTAQANLPHFVELLGSLAALRFFSSVSPRDPVGVHLLAVEDLGRFGWRDVPGADRVQPALNRLARVCSFYLCAVHPVLNRLHDKPRAADQRTPWYRDILLPRGLTPALPEHWQWFEAMQTFATRYLIWLRGVQNNRGNVAVELVEAQSLQQLSNENRRLSQSEFRGDLLKQGRSISLGQVWREFCHVCSGNPYRRLTGYRAFEKAIYKAAAMGETECPTIR